MWHRRRGQVSCAALLLALLVGGMPGLGLRAEECDSDADYSLPGCTEDGRRRLLVVDGVSGHPAAGTTVLGVRRTAAEPVWETLGKTNEVGLVTVSEDALALALVGPGYSHQVWHGTPPQVLRLLPARDIGGRLFSAQGLPLVGVSVEWPAGYSAIPPLVSAKTDATGEFRLHGVGPTSVRRAAEETNSLLRESLSGQTFGVGESAWNGQVRPDYCTAPAVLLSAYLPVDREHPGRLVLAKEDSPYERYPYSLPSTDGSLDVFLPLSVWELRLQEQHKSDWRTCWTREPWPHWARPSLGCKASSLPEGVLRIKVGGMPPRAEAREVSVVNEAHGQWGRLTLQQDRDGMRHAEWICAPGRISVRLEPVAGWRSPLGSSAVHSVDVVPGQGADLVLAPTSWVAGEVEVRGTVGDEPTRWVSAQGELDQSVENECIASEVGRELWRIHLPASRAARATIVDGGFVASAEFNNDVPRRAVVALPEAWHVDLPCLEMGASVNVFYDSDGEVRLQHAKGGVRVSARQATFVRGLVVGIGGQPNFSEFVAVKRDGAPVLNIYPSEVLEVRFPNELSGSAVRVDTPHTVFGETCDTAFAIDAGGRVLLPKLRDPYQVVMRMPSVAAIVVHVGNVGHMIAPDLCPLVLKLGDEAETGVHGLVMIGDDLVEVPAAGATVWGLRGTVADVIADAIGFRAVRRSVLFGRASALTITLAHSDGR